MSNKEKLKEVMGFIIKEYPEGCASYNWMNSNYIDIAEGNLEIEDYEIEYLVEECIEEFTNDLGMCGCGIPGDTIEIIRLILEAQAIREWKDRKIKLDNICDLDSDKNDNYYGLIQFVLYILDNKGFLEHGGSVGSAWLTEKGERLLDLLNIDKELESNE